MGRFYYLRRKGLFNFIYKRLSVPIKVSVNIKKDHVKSPTPDKTGYRQKSGGEHYISFGQLPLMSRCIWETILKGKSLL